MIAYVDTSALVKLYVSEVGSQEMREEVARADSLATSLVTYVEVRAAIARRAREGDVSREDKDGLLTTMEADWERYAVVGVSDPLCRLAAELCDSHPLRGVDALHLASALTVKAQSGQPVTFLCFDERLRSAAYEEGLLID
jgi:predicted nucleic acid-binding protein